RLRDPRAARLLVHGPRRRERRALLRVRERLHVAAELLGEEGRRGRARPELREPELVRDMPLRHDRRVLRREVAPAPRPEEDLVVALDLLERRAVPCDELARAAELGREVRRGLLLGLR